MTTTTSKIDRFDFVTLGAPPQFGRMNRAVRTRPGVTGAAVINLGLWAQPFTVSATSVHASVAAALDAYATGYLPLTAGPAVGLHYAGLPMASLGARFHVLGVEVQDIRPVIGQGPAGAYGAVMRTQWTLQAA